MPRWCWSHLPQLRRSAFRRRPTEQGQRGARGQVCFGLCANFGLHYQTTPGRADRMYTRPSWNSPHETSDSALLYCRRCSRGPIWKMPATLMGILLIQSATKIRESNCTQASVSGTLGSGNPFSPTPPRRPAISLAKMPVCPGPLRMSPGPSSMADNDGTLSWYST